MRIFLSLLLGGIVISTIGCGGHTMMDPCTIIGLTVGPASATVNHAAAPPTNGQSFVSNPRFFSVCGSATAIPLNSNWTASDPSVHLSPAPGGTTTATCPAPRVTPAPITATSADASKFIGTATLTSN